MIKTNVYVDRSMLKVSTDKNKLKQLMGDAIENKYTLGYVSKFMLQIEKCIYGMN